MQKTAKNAAKQCWEKLMGLVLVVLAFGWCWRQTMYGDGALLVLRGGVGGGGSGWMWVLVLEVWVLLELIGREDGLAMEVFVLWVTGVCWRWGRA